MKKLESTRKIIPGAVLRGYLKGFGYAKLVVIETNEYYLAVRADEDFFNYSRDNDRIEAYLWMENVASYEFASSVIGKIISGPPILFLAHTDAITRSAKRKCLSAKVKIPIKFFTFNPDDAAQGITTEEVAYHAGSITRLSDRDATIQTSASLRGARFLNGLIRINKKELELIGTITGIDRAKKTCTIHFTGMHDKVRKRLLDYVYSIYRE